MKLSKGSLRKLILKEMKYLMEEDDPFSASESRMYTTDEINSDIDVLRNILPQIISAESEYSKSQGIILQAGRSAAAHPFADLQAAMARADEPITLSELLKRIIELGDELVKTYEQSGVSAIQR